MRAHFGLPSVEAEDKEGKPPISVKFEIPYFTTSGIQVRKLSLWVLCQPIWDFSDLVHYASCFSFICPTPVNVGSKWTSLGRGWNFTCVPFQVRYLKIIEKSGYQALPWVRYITQNGGMWKDTLLIRNLQVALQPQNEAGISSALPGGCHMDVYGWFPGACSKNEV